MVTAEDVVRVFREYLRDRPYVAAGFVLPGRLGNAVRVPGIQDAGLPLVHFQLRLPRPPAPGPLHHLVVAAGLHP